MYLIGFPLLLIPLAIYNIIAYLFGLGFSDTVFQIPMLSRATLDVSTGDLLIIFSIFLLFLEILKATRIGTKSIVDHILSFVVFIAMVGEFMILQRAATSTFLLLVVIAFVDVVGGFSVSIRTAQRDIGLDGIDRLSNN
ncbi:MAG: hypothetical protein M5U33_12875 [Pseudorhodoplanes sp.]|nr:hypothetical protein [Pseudorhodoplanes sp.]MCL4710141.1 hypothetical protein [Pseudorhodoplanes sp.]MCQ3942016.1 hypothetical protein [Alphaproteobacteria bacterium]MCZ7643393.1 hypothetical protein [Pseudorhodoplanes sp.]GIK79837.1 MAG: hypothetical protein BroJett024_09420 [Alphaproteobacteria bacterium]